jgi:hypothetical protein
MERTTSHVKNAEWNVPPLRFRMPNGTYRLSCQECWFERTAYHVKNACCYILPLMLRMPNGTYHRSCCLAIFFGVFLRRLIREIVNLLAGCCGQWCAVSICWHELWFLRVQMEFWGRCAMLDLGRTKGHGLWSWELLTDKILCWKVCCFPITRGLSPNWLKA